MIRSGVMRIGREHGNSYNGKGLKHIDWKHVQTLGDFESLEEAIDVIEDVIKNGEIKPDKDPQNIALEKNHYRVVIARDKNGNWVLTAFDKNESAKEKKKEPIVPTG